MGKIFSKGRIVNVRRADEPYGVIVQGAAAKNCCDGFGYTGGNGSYRSWDGGVKHRLYVDVSIYVNDNHKESIDIRDKVLAVNGRQKVTDAFVTALKEKICGKKIFLVFDQGGWEIADWSELDLKL